MVLPTVTRRFLTDGICRGGNPTGDFGRRKMRSMAFKAALAAIIVSIPLAGAFAATSNDVASRPGGLNGGGDSTGDSAPLAGRRPMGMMPPATTATINTMPVHRHHYRHHHHKLPAKNGENKY
ncbi:MULTISPECIES: hypothetical protein [Hyphomicrobiales]|uniref:hypothetical protein n=1 Tax=Hyphomicrobiales TaxID=356 RepID=UPI0012F83D09|nr:MULTISPECIES: hypothetical protein [Phyllobacteriaceae]MCX8567520.1 hypothetical protein [Aminobacter sp. MET-1]